MGERLPNRTEVLPTSEQERNLILSDSQKKLDELRQDIESWIFNEQLLSWYIEMIENVESENKPLFLSGILSAFYKNWAHITEIKWNEIKFSIAKQRWNFNQEKLNKLQNILNKWINDNKFKITDVKKAILYSSSWVKDFLDRGENIWNINEYLKYLLSKYPNINFIGDDINSIKSGLNWMSDEEYEVLKNRTRVSMKNNIHDYTLLTSILDDLRFNEWNGIKDLSLEEYQSTVDENEKRYLETINNLSEEDRYYLNQIPENELRAIEVQLKTDPAWLLSDNFNNWWKVFSVILWILWFIFAPKGKRLVTWWLLAIAWMFAPSLFNLWKDFLEGTKFWENNENYSNKPLHNKFKHILNPENLPGNIERWILVEKYNSLLSNSIFLRKDSSDLNIFKRWDNYQSIVRFFSSIWIELNDSNKYYYEYIFNSLFDEKRSNWIELKEWEKIVDFLNRSSSDTWNNNPTLVTNQDSQSNWEWNEEEEVGTWETIDEDLWLSDTIDDDSFNEILERFNLRWYIEDWKYYLIWDDWESRMIESNILESNFLESLERFWPFSKRLENFDLIISTLVKSDSEQYNEINEYYQDRVNNLDISSRESIELFSRWISSKARELTKTNINLENDEQVLSFIRSIDSNMAREMIVDELFSLTNISEEELINFIENPWSENQKIKDLLWNENYRKVRWKVREKQTQADNYFDDYKWEFLNQLIQSWKTEEEANIILENDIKWAIVSSFVWSFARNEIFKSYVEWLSDTWSFRWYRWENRLIRIYSDIEWIWAFDLSDKNWDSIKFWSKEWFFILGTQVVAIAAWALTMWAWYVWVNALVWWTRWYKWIRALQTASTFANSWARFSRLAQVWRWWSMSAIWWASFYAWYGWTQSLTEWRNMYSWEWLGHSILYAWAFRALSSIPGLRLNPSIPLSQQKLRLTTATAVDAIAFSSIWLTLEWVILEPGEWNADLIMQAIVMAAIFRVWWATLWKIKLRNKNNRVEIVDWASSTPVSFYRHTNWKTYTRTIDWKYRNKDWKIVNVKPENLNKIELTPAQHRTLLERGGDYMKSFMSWITESKMISWVNSWLSESRKKIFESSLKWLKNWWWKVLNFWKDLTYRWFGEWWPWFKTWNLWLISTVWWAWYFSAEEIKDIIISVLDPNKDIATWENWVNLATIVWNLWMFRTIWLIRAATYNLLLEEIFYKFENQEQ